MVRWVSGLVLLGVLACSSSTTNESGSGGSAAGGSAGTSSGGSSSGGTGGAAPKCQWTECKVLAQGAACGPQYNACDAAGDCLTLVASYVGCACAGGGDSCPLPQGLIPAALINCLAKEPAISPKCFGVDCRAMGQPCSITGFGQHCCGDLKCPTGTCN